MPRFLLRAEAVNFAWSCYDTTDLSTIRGGSMLMMNAHKLISTTARAHAGGTRSLAVGLVV